MTKLKKNLQFIAPGNAGNCYQVQRTSKKSTTLLRYDGEKVKILTNNLLRIFKQFNVEVN